MTVHEFLPSDGSRVLTADAFQFVLDNELKRAGRSHSYLTLLEFRVETRDRRERSTPAERTVDGVATAAARGLRNTDLIGRTGRGALSVVLLDSDFESSGHVIERLIPTISGHARPDALRLSIGAACYPTHAVDAPSLRRRAAASVVARTGRPGASRGVAPR